jgi:hypothetical protein
VNVTLRYERAASTATDVSGVVRDLFSAKLQWVPRRNWRVTVTAIYELRDQPGESFSLERVLAPATIGGIPDVAEQVGFLFIGEERDLRAVSYFAGIFVQHFVNRRTWVFFNINWSRSELRGDFVNTVPSDRLRVGIGVVYTFPQFHLPF